MKVRRGLVLALVALAGSPAGAASSRDHEPGVRPLHHRRLLRRELLNGPLYIPPLQREPIPPLQEPTPPAPLPAPHIGPVAPIGPLPSGFTMTLTQGSEADPPRDEPIGKPRDIARRIAACWSPPSFDGPPAEITLRLQFSKGGGIIGQPRVSYVAAPKDQRAAVTTSMQAALRNCTPLRFTARLGAGIAGYPFAIRFIAARRKTEDQQ